MCRSLSGLLCVLFVSLGCWSSGAALTVSIKDAVDFTLRHNPGVKIEKEKLEESGGQAQEASGRFDWTIEIKDIWEKESDELSPAEKLFLFKIQGARANVPDILNWEGSLYEIGISRELRSGVTITPELAGTDVWDNLVGGSPANRPVPGVKISVPLLRGFGSSVAGADELAARSNLKAASALYAYNVSLRVYQTIAAYWDCLAALKDYQTAGEMKKTAEDIAGVIERLVRGGQMRPSVLHQVEGALAERKMELVKARGHLSQAEQELGFRMGLTPEGLKDAPLPRGHFPTVLDWSGPRIESLKSKLAEEALKRRGDLLSARQNTHTQEALLRKAENGLLPRLDLQSRVSFTSLQESSSADRFFSAYGQDYTGPNFYVQLNLEIPLENNFARGELHRRQALSSGARLRSVQLNSRVASDVTVALTAFESSISEYEQAGRVAENYERAVDDQVRLVKEIQGNITDLITMENRYFQGRLDEIEAQRRYAIALADLRLVSGTLMTTGGAVLKFDADAISRPPFIYGENGDKPGGGSQ